MTGNIWIDLELAWQMLRPGYPACLASYPHTEWANVGLRERSTMHSTSTAYLAVRGAVSSMATRPVPRCKCSSHPMMTAAPVYVRP